MTDNNQINEQIAKLNNLATLLQRTKNEVNSKPIGDIDKQELISGINVRLSRILQSIELLKGKK